MAKHDPRVPCSVTWVDTKREIDELCDLWNDKGGEGYLKRIDSDDFLTLYGVYARMAESLVDVVAEHALCQAGRKNPRYWRGSRTARN